MIELAPRPTVHKVPPENIFQMFVAPLIIVVAENVVAEIVVAEIVVATIEVAENACQVEVPEPVSFRKDGEAETDTIGLVCVPPVIIFEPGVIPKIDVPRP